MKLVAVYLTPDLSARGSGALSEAALRFSRSGLVNEQVGPTLRVMAGWLQGARRREGVFHSKVLQRRRRTNTRKPFGLGPLSAHPGVASRLF